jgi:hypothetical protein
MRLGNAQHFGGFGLRHAALFQPVLQANQQLRAFPSRLLAVTASLGYHCAPNSHETLGSIP